MEMYKLKIMNSTGAGVTEVVRGDKTIADLMDDVQYNGILIGNQIALNGVYINEINLHLTLEELECDPVRTNVLSAIKPANGAY